jgi:Ras GTPase-activating-like protein IQGAP2/3
VEAYLDKVVDVRDPEEYLEVDQYNELVQRAKPVIVISTHEIVRIHTMVEKHLGKLAPDNDDNLRVIMKDLGPVPPLPNTEKDIQLWLSNRFKADVPEDPEEKKLYNATKELVLPVLRQVPIEQSIRKLNLMDVLEAGIKHAAATNNKELSNQINKILENISKLEEYGMVTKDDNYESFVHAVALEVANRATIRENQRKEISRLNAALNKLRQHQSYIKDQIRDYNSYLQGARKAAYAVDPKKKKKGTGPPGTNTEQGRIGPFKFTYKELEKQGVIVDSEVMSVCWSDARERCVCFFHFPSPFVFFDSIWRCARTDVLLIVPAPCFAILFFSSTECFICFPPLPIVFLDSIRRCARMRVLRIVLRRNLRHSFFLSAAHVCCVLLFSLPRFPSSLGRLAPS